MTSPAPKDVLWEEAPRSRQIIADDGDTETLKTKAIAWVKENAIHVGVHVWKEGEWVTCITMELCVPDIFQLHLTYRFLQKIDVVSAPITRGIGYSIAPAHNQQLSEYLPALIGALTQPVYDHITKEVPTDVLRTMDFLNEHGVRWSRSALTDAVRTQRIAYDPLFRLYGVMHPAEVHSVELPDAASGIFLQPLFPHFAAYQQLRDFPEMHALLSAAIHVGRWGLTEAADVVGAAILYCCKRHSRRNCWYFPGVVLMRMRGTPSLESIAAFVGQQFQMGTVDAYTARLKAIDTEYLGDSTPAIVRKDL